jgi:predicted RNase H-like HicB family nuclease
MKKEYLYIVNVYWSQEDGAFVAEVPELPGCASHGRTRPAAARNVDDAIETWIEGAKESGIKVPEPIATKKFSGKFVTRVEPRVHRALALKAETEGKSLNGFVQEVLEEAAL